MVVVEGRYRIGAHTGMGQFPSDRRKKTDRLQVGVDIQSDQSARVGVMGRRNLPFYFWPAWASWTRICHLGRSQELRKASTLDSTAR